MTARNNPTFLQYLEHLSSGPASTVVPQDELEKLNHSRASGLFTMNSGAAFTYILDYTTCKYVFLSPQSTTQLNYSPKKFDEGGLDFLLSNYHPSDLIVYDKEIFRERYDLLKTIPPDQHKNYLFTYNYRVKGGDGNYVNLLSRTCFIKSDEHGKPLFNLGMVQNVNHFVQENPVIQVTEKMDPETGCLELVQKNTYYLNDEYRLFTKREKELLKYLADGLTSKEIADRLFLSTHTINTHKKNMHHKSNTQNTVGLLGFAAKHHLL